MIRVFLSGEHARRTPLSYPALADLFADQIALVDRADEAEMYLFAHILDVQAAPHSVILDWRQRRVPVVILSEEPFWDTVWGRRPLDRLIYVDTALGALPVHQLTHQTSDIFRFDHIPYYLLTEPGFIHAYRDRFTRNAALGPADWQAEFASRALQTVFMFERRPEPFHNVRWPEADLIGLCAWRTELAEAMQGPGTECLGRTWQGGKRRQALEDWHADKLARLDRRSCRISAYENTHQNDYLTEKLFDAYACGAIPLYFAAPGHRVHDLSLPPESWINSYGLSPSDAAAALVRHVPDLATCDAFAAAQGQLAALFSDDALIAAERQRLRAAVLSALTDILDGPDQSRA